MTELIFQLQKKSILIYQKNQNYIKTKAQKIRTIKNPITTMQKTLLLLLIIS